MGLILFVAFEALVLVLIGAAMLRVHPRVSAPASPYGDVVTPDEGLPPRRAGPARANRVPVVVLVVVIAFASLPAIAWAVVIIANRSRGLDVSDESYYVLNAHRPAAVVASSSEFLFYLRPLLAFGGSLAGMRVLGLGVLLGAVALSGLAVSMWSPPVGRRARLVLGGVLAVPIAAVTLTYYGIWLPTPSYNLLSITLAMIAGATTIVAARGIGSRRASTEEGEVGGTWIEVVLGFTLVIGVAVKPPAFVAVTVLCVSVLLVFTGRRWAACTLGRLIAGMVAAVFVHWAIVTDGPVNDLRRVARGVEGGRLLKSHPAAQLLEPDFVRDEVVPWLLILLAASIVAVIVRRRVASATWRLVAFALLAAGMAWPLVFQIPAGGEAMLGSGAGWWWMRLASATLLWTTAAAHSVDRALILGPFLALLAPACALGSGNGFIRMVGLSAGLLAMGVMTQTVIVASGWESVHRVLSVVPALIFVGVGSVASLAIRADAVVTPYRLDLPLSADMVAVDLGPAGRVEVPAKTAAYVHDLRTISSSIGPAPRECFVDLTGGTPIAALALDARPAAVPWILGGYPGSAEFAAFVLGHAGCLDGPILLLEAPEGARHIPRPALLGARTFETVGSVRFSGYLVETQVLSVSESQE